MMNKIEEAIIYATVMHQGKVRKLKHEPYILHPLEVAQILSTITNDEDVITAGILHDIVEETDGSLAEIEKRFGSRVAFLVASESEDSPLGVSPDDSWRQRKVDSLRVLKNSKDIGVKMLWLADKLSNIRGLAGAYSEKGDKLFEGFHQKDTEMQQWYFRSVAEYLELSLNKTAAFKELIKHINYIWPGTFSSGKDRYRKYREVSVEGCRLIGHGSKGDVYHFNDELVVKVYNHNNTYRDVEQEIALSRKAFILGIPTAISFGIVSVGDRYGAMYELVDSETLSGCISRSPEQTNRLAKMMAEIAHTIHTVEISEADTFPEAYTRVCGYIEEGIGRENADLARKCKALLDALPATCSLLHGDFHTGNVVLQKGEPFLIDMARLSTGHPILEISDMYYFYVLMGEDSPVSVENFMGFSYETAQRFFRDFLRHYLKTEDENRLSEVTEKASLIGLSRMIRKIRNKGTLSDKDLAQIHHLVERIDCLTKKLDTLTF